MEAQAGKGAFSRGEKLPDAVPARVPTAVLSSPAATSGPTAAQPAMINPVAKLWKPLVALAVVAGGIAVAASRTKAGVEVFDKAGPFVEALLRDDCVVAMLVHESLLPVVKEAVGDAPAAAVIATTDPAALDLPGGARWRVITKDGRVDGDRPSFLATGTDGDSLKTAISSALGVAEACLAGAPVGEGVIDYDEDGEAPDEGGEAGDEVYEDYEDYESIIEDGSWVAHLWLDDAGELVDDFGESFGSGDEALVTCPHHAIVIVTDKGSQFEIYGSVKDHPAATADWNIVELSDYTLFEMVLLDDFMQGQIAVYIHLPNGEKVRLEIVSDTEESCLEWAI